MHAYQTVIIIMLSIYYLANMIVFDVWKYLANARNTEEKAEQKPHQGV